MRQDSCMKRSFLAWCARALTYVAVFLLVVGWTPAATVEAQGCSPVLYDAVWAPGTDGEIQVYGWKYDDYRARYDQLWGQGWCLKILQAYVLNGQVLYNAVWSPSTEGEMQVYGWTQSDFRAKNVEFATAGWRLSLLQ